MGHALSAGTTGAVVGVVQARMSSSRLPGKVLMPLGGGTVLSCLVDRLDRANLLDRLVVATSTDRSDDPVVEACEQLSVEVFRGSLTDVLGRVVSVARATNADAVVRITGDCPLTDPSVVDDVVRCWHRSGADYVTNTIEPRSFPDGLDVEVLTASALDRVNLLATSGEDREHVTTFVRRHQELFRHAEVRLEPALGDLRVTLDTHDDLELIQRLIERVGSDAPMDAIIRALGGPMSVSSACSS